MATIKIDLGDAPAYFGEKQKQYRAAAELGLFSAAMRAVQVIQTVIIPSRSPSPTDRGHYRAGWRFQRVKGGAEIFNDDPTAVFVEEGVRGENVKPGFAMLNALAEWCLRKGLASDLIEAKGVAWAIAKSMQKKGIFNRGSKGLGIMKELVETRLGQIAMEEVEREIKAVFG